MLASSAVGIVCRPHQNATRMVVTQPHTDVPIVTSGPVVTTFVLQVDVGHALPSGMLVKET